MPHRFLTRLITLSVFTAALSYAIAAPQVDAGQQLSIPSVGLTMRIPAGWHQGGFSGESVLASYIEGSGLYPGFSVTREDHSGAPPRAVFESWTELLSSPDVTAVEEREISGHAAVFADVSWSSLLGSLRAIRLIIALERQVLIVSFNERGDGMTPERADAYGAFLATLSLSPTE